MTYSNTLLQAVLAAIVHFYFTKLLIGLISRTEKVGGNKREGGGREGNKMKIFQDNGLHRKRAFNQYFNGKPSCADCKNGFGAHSKQTHLQQNSIGQFITSEFINSHTYWKVLEDRTNSELNKFSI